MTALVVGRFVLCILGGWLTAIAVLAIDAIRAACQRKREAFLHEWDPPLDGPEDENCWLACPHVPTHRDRSVS